MEGTAPGERGQDGVRPGPARSARGSDEEEPGSGGGCGGGGGSAPPADAPPEPDRRGAAEGGGGGGETSPAAGARTPSRVSPAAAAELRARLRVPGCGWLKAVRNSPLPYHPALRSCLFMASLRLPAVRGWSCPARPAAARGGTRSAGLPSCSAAQRGSEKAEMKNPNLPDEAVPPGLGDVVVCRLFFACEVLAPL